MRAWKAALIARWKAQSEMAMQRRLALWRFESHGMRVVIEWKTAEMLGRIPGGEWD